MDRLHEFTEPLETYQVKAPTVKISIVANFPGASWVYVFGFGDWTRSRAMEATGDGSTFTADVALVPGIYEYKFMVDGKWLHDPSKRVNSRGNHMITFKEFVEVLSHKNTELEELARAHVADTTHSGHPPNEQKEAEFARTTLEKVFRDHRFRELTIRVNGTHLHTCHRAVVAAHSPLLSDLLLKAPTNIVDITTTVPEPEAFGELLGYFYFGTIPKDITPTRLGSLMQLAAQFHVTQIVPVLHAQASQIIGAGNCLHVMQMFPHDASLVSPSIAIAARNFGFIARQPEFLKVSWENLKEILNHPDLHISTPQFVVDSLKRWQNVATIHDKISVSHFVHIDRFVSAKRDTLSATIVCFFADGSDRYTAMTTVAMRTFLECTPGTWAGLLTHDKRTFDAVMEHIPSTFHHRIVHRYTSSEPHFPSWNPTQYKLDIEQFSDSFDSIIWMDSDTITTRNLQHFLLEFTESTALFYLVKDHVNFDDNFKRNWRDNVFPKYTMIPQACVMGFKSSIIRDFFMVWKEVWAEWITPKPFVRYADPNPGFQGSAFCIEQYALGMALERFLSTRSYPFEPVREFSRTLIALPGAGPHPTPTPTSDTSPQNTTTGTTSPATHKNRDPADSVAPDRFLVDTTSPNGQQHMTSQLLHHEIPLELTSNILAQIPGEVSSEYFGELSSQLFLLPGIPFGELSSQFLYPAGLFASFPEMSSQLLSLALQPNAGSQYSLLLSHDLFLGGISQNLGSYRGSLDFWNVSSPGNISIPFNVGSLHPAVYAGASAQSQTTGNAAAHVPPFRSFVIVDYFGGGLVHSYNQNYGAALQWYQNQPKST